MKIIAGFIHGMAIGGIITLIYLFACGAQAAPKKAGTICFAHAVFSVPTGIRVIDPRTGKPQTCHDPDWDGEGF